MQSFMGNSAPPFFKVYVDYKVFLSGIDAASDKFQQKCSLVVRILIITSQFVFIYVSLDLQKTRLQCVPDRNNRGELLRPLWLC